MSARTWRQRLAAYVAVTDHWRHHPHVPSHHELPIGDRAADRLRNGMGSWSFVFAALLFLAVWMCLNAHHGPDPYPYILLNLMLSCLAALQGAILLIAAKRSDAVSAAAAAADYEVNRTTKVLVEQQHTLITEMRADHAALRDQLTALAGHVQGGGS